MTRPDHGHGPHPRRSWLHLLARDPLFEPSPTALEEAREVLLAAGMAVEDGEGGLLPGPRFPALLRPPGTLLVLPQPGRPRGEVRIDAGVWRCYPDPGPDGFDSSPVQDYGATCPSCGRRCQFFILLFPYQDPMMAQCPDCQAKLPLLEMNWDPELPMGRMEITFGDLDGRPSLRELGLFAELERALGTDLRETHVTL